MTHYKRATLNCAKCGHSVTILDVHLNGANHGQPIWFNHGCPKCLDSNEWTVTEGVN